MLYRVDFYVKRLKRHEIIRYFYVVEAESTIWAKSKALSIWYLSHIRHPFGLKVKRVSEIDGLMKLREKYDSNLGTNILYVEDNIQI